MVIEKRSGDLGSSRKLPKEPTKEMLLAGARSIGSSMRQENHNERARECWKAMVDSYLDGTEQPLPKSKK